jgi:hypothetical protein
VSPFIDPVTKKKVAFVEKAKAGPNPSKAAATPASDAADADVIVDGGGDGAAVGGLEARFRLEHIEECMGGCLKGSLFDLAKYRARMMVGRAQGSSPSGGSCG